MAFGSVPHPHSLASTYCFPFVVSFLLFYTLIFDFPLPESAAPALFAVNQLTAEILLHVIHSIGGLPKTPERYKNVSAIVGAFLFPESR